MTISRNLVGVCGALAALGLAGSAMASVNLVKNGGFEHTKNPFIGGLNGDKKKFVTAAPTFWSGGGGLTFLAAPGTADDYITPKYMAVWDPFPTSSGPGISGGNMVLADGDLSYSGSFSQMLNFPSGGLYDVKFGQAAGQQYTYSGATTEQWKVTLGGVPQWSSLMSTPSQGVTPWQSESLQFNIPNAGSFLLEFLAVGTPPGEPPVSFLDNVSVRATVPAPASLAMVGAGLLGSAGRRRTRRA